MGGRSAEALARRAEKRGRTAEEEAALDVEKKSQREEKRREEKRREAKPREAKPSHPAPPRNRGDDFQLQREINAKLAHGSRQEIYGAGCVLLSNHRPAVPRSH